MFEVVVDIPGTQGNVFELLREPLDDEVQHVEGQRLPHGLQAVRVDRVEELPEILQKSIQERTSEIKIKFITSEHGIKS
jgi:hypothetical protein